MVLGITLRYNEFDSNKIFCISHNMKYIFDKLKVTLIPICQNTNLDKIVNMCDGLILTGSPIHINAKLYKEKNLIKNDLKYNEDELDYQLITLFTKKNKPILGICRGIQIINVYFGGSLHQKIDNHEKTNHSITIKKDSFLFNIYHKKSLKINSNHTQSIKQIAPDFKIVAISDDGVIEAIEKENIWAIQWHPEHLLDFKLFKAFLNKINVSK